MNQHATVAAIKQALRKEMKDAMPLLAFLDHLKIKAAENITWEISEKESSLSISIYPAHDNALPLYFFYRNMESEKMRKHAYLQLKYGSFHIMGEDGQYTIFRDEAGEIGISLVAMLSATALQKDYYLNDIIYRQDLSLEYSISGDTRQNVFTKVFRRKPLFKAYHRIEERRIVPLISQDNGK